jgi:hypothetical protein
MPESNSKTSDTLIKLLVGAIIAGLGWYLAMERLDKIDTQEKLRALASYVQIQHGENPYE